MSGSDRVLEQGTVTSKFFDVDVTGELYIRVFRGRQDSLPIFPEEDNYVQTWTAVSESMILWRPGGVVNQGDEKELQKGELGKDITWSR